MNLHLKPHPQHKGVFVSEEGRVFVEPPASPSAGGYLMVHISSRLRYRRHVLVLETYHGPRPAGFVARHLNGNPTDDRPENLAWGTQAGNLADMVHHGRSVRGRKQHSNKLSEQEVLAIKRRRAAGESGKALSQEFGVNQATICDIVKGRTWQWLRV